jgi:hypothetical protein
MYISIRVVGENWELLLDFAPKGRFFGRCRGIDPKKWISKFGVSAV